MLLQYIQENWQDILSGTGLFLTLIGAAMTALPMRVTPKDAGELAVPRWGHEDPLENAKLPLAVSLLKNSKGATRGLWLIAIGSFFQLVPILTKLAP